MLIENGTVFTGTEFENGLSIRLMNGIVQEVGESLRAEAGEKVIDLEGDYLLPGFVDVHIHAFRGSDTMRGETDIRRMSRELAGTGTGAFCPTTMSASMEDTAKVIDGIRRTIEQPERNGARVLGAHMEAPFLSEGKAGAQRKEFFRNPSWEDLLNMAEDPSLVRLITMAPEKDGSEEFVRKASAAGIHVSIGHTQADAEKVHEAGDWGADHITHTFNAQTPLHHREPGVPGASMTDDRFFCEMICDGKHLHDDIVRLIILCKGADRAVAITDAMEAAGMPDGEYSLGGQPVFVKEGAARLADFHIFSGLQAWICPHGFSQPSAQSALPALTRRFPLPKREPAEKQKQCRIRFFSACMSHPKQHIWESENISHQVFQQPDTSIFSAQTCDMRTAFETQTEFFPHLFRDPRHELL